MSFIYLASPYTHEDPVIRDERYEQTERYIASQFLEGEFIYSPIVYCAPIAKKCALPTNHAYWREFNELMLIRARALHVLKLKGWTSSMGIKHELAFWQHVLERGSIHFITQREMNACFQELVKSVCSTHKV